MFVPYFSFIDSHLLNSSSLSTAHPQRLRSLMCGLLPGSLLHVFFMRTLALARSFSSYQPITSFTSASLLTAQYAPHPYPSSPAACSSVPSAKYLQGLLKKHRMFYYFFGSSFFSVGWDTPVRWAHWQAPPSAPLPILRAAVVGMGAWVVWVVASIAGIVTTKRAHTFLFAFFRINIG
jgi:hypothetical protein